MSRVRLVGTSFATSALPATLLVVAAAGIFGISMTNPGILLVLAVVWLLQGVGWLLFQRRTWLAVAHFAAMGSVFLQLLRTIHDGSAELAFGLLVVQVLLTALAALHVLGRGR